MSRYVLSRLRVEYYHLMLYVIATPLIHALAFTLRFSFLQEYLVRVQRGPNPEDRWDVRKYLVIY